MEYVCLFMKPSIAKIIQRGDKWNMEHWRKNEKRKTEVLGGQPVQGPLRPPQIPHELFGNITQKQHLVIQRNEN